MKKFIKVFSVCLILFCCCLTLFACGEKEEDKFYETTNQKFSQFINDICLNEEYSSGVIYGKNIKTIINNINSGSYSSSNEKLKAYTQLNEIYDKIFVVSFKFLSNFNGIFINAPQEIPNNMKKDYADFEKSLENATQKLNQFKPEIEYLDNHIVGTNEIQASSDISLQIVREFKREYIDLSLVFVDICNEFLTLCEKYIYPNYSSYMLDGKYIELTQTQITNQKTIAVLKSAINTLTPAIEYLNSFNGDYEHLNNEKFFQVLDYYCNLDTKKENTTNVEELELWLDIYNSYLNDVECFYDSLDKISMADFGRNYNFDIEKLIDENFENYAYINKIFDFSSKSVLFLFNSVETLCN